MSSPAGPDAGSSSSGGSGGGGSSGGTPSGDGSNCPVTVDPAAVIDDMSGNNGNMNATGGYWYTYSDRTLPNSEPPILITDAGTMNPLEGTAFPVTDAAVFPNGCNWNFREVIGGGEKTWGAGFGMDFQSTPPDGGEVAFNMCDAGEIFCVTCLDSGTVGIVQPYDASQWSGIQFWGISFNGKNQAVWLQMDDDRTSPWGGVCNACNTSGGQVNPCSDSFRKQFTFTPTWTQFTLTFNDPLFKPQNWSKNNVMTPIDTKKIYNLHFQVTAAPAPAFDLGVAMVTFFK